MTRDDIRALFEELAQSQGFYGRLLRQIDSADPEKQNDWWSYLESQNFSDAVDVIMFIEG